MGIHESHRKPRRRYGILSNDPGKVESNFFCFAGMVFSPRRNVLIFTQRMHKPTGRPLKTTAKKSLQFYMFST